MAAITMGYPDIQRAREGQSALQRIVQAHAGTAADLRALRRVVDLCRDVGEAIEDDYCREKVRLVAEYAAELLSHDEHRARGAMAGVDFLREQIRSALELLESRLYSLERARRYGLKAGHQVFARAAFGVIAR
jgi:light-regulated signal transduction histidine kinase (bacteriophytochrome)